MDQERAAFYEAYIARESVGVLREKLKEEQMEDLFEKIEMPLVFTLYEMEKNGVKIASDELHAYGQMLGEREKELEESIYEMAGEVFNINSPKQLGVILFEKMELPNKKKTKTGYSTAAGVLEKLAPDYPIVSKILEYRQVAKLKSTYAGRIGQFYTVRRTDPRQISSDRDSNRQNQQFRSESSEHSGEDGTWTHDPKSVYSGRGLRVCGCGLFSD